MKIIYGSIFLVILLIFSGCSSVSTDDDSQSEPTPSNTPYFTQGPPQITPLISPQETGTDPVQVAVSDKKRIAAISATTQDLQELSEGNLAFVSDLYAALRTRDDNFLFSPYSISQALAMTYAGARGETEEQMAGTLHFTLPQDRLHSAFSDLDIQFAQRGENAKGKDGGGFQLNIVNATWGQQGYTFLPQYLDILAQYYGAGMYLLDFITAPEPSRITINEWVSDQTEGRIEDLLPPDTIDEYTRLVLTNAIYFNAAWKSPFNEDLTREGIFHLLDGRSKTVSMMKQTEYIGYNEGNNYQAVELLYSGGELSMVIILPGEGDFSNFEKAMDQNVISDIQGNMEYREVALSMPGFEFESSIGLKQILSSMGMPIAFSVEEADFSGMNGARDLHIADVLHKTFISVNEAGTEAAAATAVMVGVGSIPDEPIEVTVNRPFVFLIRDIETGTVLFIGRILDPSV